MTDLDRRVTGGVDTHKDTHVAAALDELGRVLDTAAFPATTAGYRSLLSWLASFGELVAVGVEGTGAVGCRLGPVPHRSRRRGDRGDPTQSPASPASRQVRSRRRDRRGSSGAVERSRRHPQDRHR